MRLIIVAWIALAGCGRLGFGGMASDTSDADVDVDAAIDAALADAAVDGPAPRVADMVTGLSGVAAGAVELGVSGSPTGFYVTWVRPPGSMMTGINLTTGFVPDADWRITSSRPDYVGTTNTWTGTKMTTMSTSGRTTFIKRYVDDLSSYAQTDSRTGFAAKPAYAQAGGRWYFGIVDTTTFLVAEINTMGVPTGTQLQTMGTSGTAYAASIAGDDQRLFAIHSTMPGTCGLQVITPGVPLARIEDTIPGTCRNPRIAASGGGNAVAVWDDGAAIQTASVTSTGPQPSGPALAAGAGSRLAFDGTAYWMVWLDAGTLRAATWAPGGSPTVVPVVLPSGSIQAYEIVTRAGVAYVFALVQGNLWHAQLSG